MITELLNHLNELPKPPVKFPKDKVSCFLSDPAIEINEMSILMFLDNSTSLKLYLERLLNENIGVFARIS